MKTPDFTRTIWNSSGIFTEKSMFMDIDVFSSLFRRVWSRKPTLFALSNNFVWVCVINLIPAWVSNHIYYKMWDEVIYPSPNFNGGTVEVWEWISNFIPHFTGSVIAYQFDRKGLAVYNTCSPNFHCWFERSIPLTEGYQFGLIYIQCQLPFS